MFKKMIVGVLFLFSSLGANELHSYSCEVQNSICKNTMDISAMNIDDAEFNAFLAFSKDVNCKSIMIDDVNCTVSSVAQTSSLTLPTTNSNPIFNKKKNHTVVSILYGTDRGLHKNASFENRYGGERSNLKFGKAEVSIPHSHVFGEIERPKSYLWQDETIGRDIVITHLENISRNQFSKLLNKKLQGVEQDDILIFIHGFNVTFASSIRQTAQLAYDLKFKGVPLTYSWPSKGGLDNYPVDETTVKSSVPKLVEFFKEIIQQRGSANIHVIGHSMGTRVLTNALKELSYEYSTPQFKNIILAAPDIDTLVFKEALYPKLKKITEKVTLYASFDDSALSISKGIHGARRLGQGGELITVFDNMVTIDATGIDDSMLGHSYFSEIEVLVNDLRAVINKSLPPMRRKNLHVLKKSKLLFWKFKAFK